MRRRRSVLTAALALALGALLTPRIDAQNDQNSVKPTAWPWIDVYGATGKSFGTIRIVQQVLHGRLDHGLVAEFVPNGDKLLSELAAQLWPGVDPKDLHFNWLQITVQSGKPPLPIDAAFHTLIAPFVDPPTGGYYGDTKKSDDLPWYLDETPYTPHVSSDLNINNTNVAPGYVLRWYAKPYSNAVPDSMHFDTVLVLINDRLSQYQPLGGFHWTAKFPESHEPAFSLMPFGPEEWFDYAALIAEFNKGAAGKKNARVWTLRPLPAPTKQEADAKMKTASTGQTPVKLRKP